MGSGEIRIEIKKVEIAVPNDSIPLSDWQKAELGHRLQRYRQGYVKTFMWESAHEILRSKYIS